MKHTCDRRYFAEVNTSDKAYWLGFIAADGCVSDSQVIINLQRGDKSHLEKFRFSISGSQNVVEHNDVVFGKVREFAKVVISSRGMVNDLNSLGIVRNKSAVGIVPWTGSTDLMSHYYRGLFDGDGWISTTQVKGRIYWDVGFCGCEAIVKAFADFVGLGTVRQRDEKLWHCHTVGIKKARSIVSKLYDGATLYLDRKKIIVDQLLAATTERDLFEKYKWVTREQLQSWFEEKGSWRKVEKAVGINRVALRRLKEKYEAA